MRTIVRQQSLRPSPVRASLELPLLRRASPSPSSGGQMEWSRSRPLARRSPLPTSRSHSELESGHQPGEGYRLTRTMSELPRSTRSYFSSASYGAPYSSTTSNRHHSLVAMRTYYAFGARSGLLDRNLDHSSSVSLSTYGLWGASSPSSSSLHDSSYAPSTVRRSYQPTVSPSTRRLGTSAISSSSTVDRYYSTKSKSSGYSSSSSPYSPSSAIASSSSPSSYRSTAYYRTSAAATAYRPSTATSVEFSPP